MEATTMNSPRPGSRTGAPSRLETPTPEISNRRAETFLIGVLWLVFTLALKPVAETLDGMAEQLPLVATALGHGIRAALAS